jgi:hypothetical protein
MRNVRHDPHVSLSVVGPDNPCRYLEVHGVVERVVEDSERAFIDGLSERYLGQRPYPYHRPGDQRMIVYIRPTGTSAMAA